MTYKIDACRFLARCLALLEQGKNWFYQCQDVTEWDIRSWCWQLGFPVGQQYLSHHECALLQVGTRFDMTLDIART